MRRGSSYESLNSGMRAAIWAAMNFYQVDHENKRFLKIMEDIMSDIREGKQLHQGMAMNKEYWDR